MIPFVVQLFPTYNYCCYHIAWHFSFVRPVCTLECSVCIFSCRLISPDNHLIIASTRTRYAHTHRFNTYTTVRCIHTHAYRYKHMMVKMMPRAEKTCVDKAQTIHPPGPYHAMALGPLWRRPHMRALRSRGVVSPSKRSVPCLTIPYKKQKCIHDSKLTHPS